MGTKNSRTAIRFAIGLGFGLVGWMSAPAPGQDAKKPAPAPKGSATVIVTPVEITAPTTAKPTEVVCLVEGRTIILKLAAHASVIQKGDVVAELDSSVLSEQMDAQTIVCEQAEQALADAEEQVQVALVDRDITTEDSMAVQEGLAHRAVVAAQATDAQARHVWKTLADKLPADERPVLNARAAVERAAARLKQAEARLNAIETRKAGRLRTLELQVEQAEIRLNAQKATARLERAKLDKLKDQISKCTIKAPCSGIVQIAAPRGPRSPLVREGEYAFQREVLMRILPAPYPVPASP